MLLVLAVLVALLVGAGCTGSPDGAGGPVATGSGPAARTGADSAADAAPRVVFLGDSYTAESADGDGYVPPVAEAMGWDPVLAAVRGTGYVATGTSPDSGPFEERLAAVVADRPDVVVVQGSTNDVGSSVGQVQAAAQRLYAELAVRLPEARVVVVGPLAPPGIDPAGVAAVRDALARACAAAGLPFIDPVAGGWLVPTAGLFADPVHPNETGYRQLAGELVAELRAAGL